MDSYWHIFLPRHTLGGVRDLYAVRAQTISNAHGLLFREFIDMEMEPGDAASLIHDGMQCVMTVPYDPVHPVMFIEDNYGAFIITLIEMRHDAQLNPADTPKDVMAQLAAFATRKLESK